MNHLCNWKQKRITGDRLTQLLTLKQAAERYHFPPATLYQRARAGKVWAVKVSGVIWIDPASIDPD